MRKSLTDSIQEMKIGLTSRATGGEFDNYRYQELRKTLISSPLTKDKIPDFLRYCHSTDEFWSFIKGESSTYEGRRTIIREAFNPIIDNLENQSTIEEHFKIGKQIGQGGFGVVYKVKHDLLKIDFAIKVFNPVFDEGKESDLQRFFREALILFEMQHQNIIRVFDVGLYDNRPFIRMELFEGCTLNDALRDYGLFNYPKGLTLVREIAKGLYHAHDEVKVIHRDLNK